eukprot:GILK01012215.1.p1 GENE.GILK01012215.1~~GILK01012215.1.p1  ORF type:complete len:217 (-),score=26.00 GILK01012215.1:149-799(-)
MSQLSSLVGAYGSDSEDESPETISTAPSIPLQHHELPMEVEQTNGVDETPQSPTPEADMQVIKTSCDLPPSPRGECDPELERKIRQFFLLKERGRTVAGELRASKAFSNPDILQKIVSFYDIDEIGSNYPPDIFDPHTVATDPSEFYDGIAERQLAAQQKLIDDRQKRGRPEFQSAGPQVFSSSTATTGGLQKPARVPESSDGSRRDRKRSRWDKR